MILLKKFIMRNVRNMYDFYWSDNAKQWMNNIKKYCQGVLHESFYRNQKNFKTHYLIVSKHGVYICNNMSLKSTLSITYYGSVHIYANQYNFVNINFIDRYQSEELKKIMSIIKTCYREFLLS